MLRQDETVAPVPRTALKAALLGGHSVNISDVKPAELCRGFVLTGGKSSRMGRDKALIEVKGRPLALHVAEAVAPVVASVALVGSRERHGSLGLPVVEDLFPGKGPLSGIHAALKESGSILNLMVGCDMPFLNSAFLKCLLEVAMVADAQVIAPESPEYGPEPLCAIYSRDALPAVEAALRNNELKVSRLFEQLRVRRLSADEWRRYNPHGLLLYNVNTPEEFEQARLRLEGMATAAG